MKSGPPSFLSSQCLWYWSCWSGLPLWSHQLVSDTGWPTILTKIFPVFFLYQGCQDQAKGWVRFNVQKWPVSQSAGASLALNPHFDTRTESHQSNRKSAQVCLPVLLSLRRRGAIDMVLFILSTAYNFINIISCAGWYTSKTVYQWRSITSYRFILRWLKVTIFSLDASLCCSIIFKLFNIKAALAHHPIIQKEVDKLLAKGVIVTLTGGAGIYSTVL